jgi:hypothetical protein
LFSSRTHFAFRLFSLLAAATTIALIMLAFFRGITVDVGPHHTLLITNFRIEYIRRDGTDDGFASHLASYNARAAALSGFSVGALRITSRTPSRQFSLLPYQGSGPGWQRISFPLWVLAAAAVGFATLLWWTYLQRLALLLTRARGTCECGYSRAGLDRGAPCPECGNRS